MPLQLTEAPANAGGEALRHKTWTREELAVLESLGLFDDSNFELVDGELIDKMGKNRPHVVATKAVAEALERVFGSEFVDREAPIDVAPEDNLRNEPEPDVVVLNRPTREFVAANPQPGNIVLAVEVSDSTLGLDRKTKAALYARAGIPEYWVLDLRGGRIFIHREPSAEGYRIQAEAGQHDKISPLGRTETIELAELLPGKRL